MRIILCVTNDIVTDRRVLRMAASLSRLPAQVMVIGRKVRQSMDLPEYPFQTFRFRLLANRGPLFYAEYNIRLFLLLLIKRPGILVSNDLDTLPAVYFVSWLRRLPVVYDCHEYFTEVPELIGRKWTRKTWEFLEKLFLPRIKYASTVSPSIAAVYKDKYGIEMQVVRNLPYRIAEMLKPSQVPNMEREFIILYQGSLNMGRGLELAIKAMQFMNNAKLIIVGSGDILHKLKGLAGSMGLDNKVVFPGRLMPDKLLTYTLQADLGLSLEEKLGLNYYYALPNKLFDYIQARVPVLVSDLPEMANIVRSYGIGKVNHARDAYELSLVFTEMLTDHLQRATWIANLEKAASELCWEHEEPVLLNLYRRVMADVKDRVSSTTSTNNR